jgi:MFS family permease
MTVFGTVAAALFFASSSAPTPVYPLYQERFGLSAAMLTMIFAVYSISMLVSLLTVGSLSDHVGRRPVISTALAWNAVAMLLFIEANSAGALLAARVVQGFANGAATAALGAAILDSDPERGPILNSITSFMGLAVGALLSGALVTFAPAPTQLVFALLTVASALMAVLVWWMPETTDGKPGALASLRPEAHVPPRARGALLRVAPANVAGWALGGFYFSLMPSLVRIATGVTSPFIGGLVVAVLPFTAILVVLTLRHVAAPVLLRISSAAIMTGMAVSLAGVWTHHVTVMLLGAVVAGVGFGATLSGTMRTILPLAGAHERAGLLSAYYIGGYLAFSLPAILLGLMAPVLGLPLAATLYGGGVILLSLASLAAMSRAPRSAPEAAAPR